MIAGVPYRDAFRRDCKVCGRERKPDERFSARGKCQACSDTRMVENVGQLRAHDGPYFDHWLRRLRAAVGVGLDAHDERP